MDIRYLASHGYQLWPCDVTTSGIGGYGILEIEPGFQMVSVPVIHGYWNSTTHKHIHDDITPATIYNYLVLQIEDIYGVPANTMVEGFNTLVGGNPIYWNFVTGVTNPLSPHNFNLSYYDAGVDSQEVIGFFINSIHPTAFSLVWGERP